MIPLGSCTMKLNATSGDAAGGLARAGAAAPYGAAISSRARPMVQELETWLAEITGLPAVSLEANAGSQGEYAGLLAIRRYHAARGEARRDVCLIPVSAHRHQPRERSDRGVPRLAVRCDDAGNVELAVLRARCAEQRASSGR